MFVCCSVDFHQVTHWQHPDFHAFYPTCTSYPTMLGDLLAAAIGCVGFTWVSSHVMLLLRQEFIGSLHVHIGGRIEMNG
ncbi:unnamed protein product [Heterobilharzia americana]|nr:unnamed protein product [Heterobilharzia americana]